jgi:hypothetical protein
MHTLTGALSLSTVPERLTRGLLEPTLGTFLFSSFFHRSSILVHGTRAVDTRPLRANPWHVSFLFFFPQE